MMGFASLDLYIGLLGYIAGGTLSAGAAVWIARFADRARLDRTALIWTCSISAIWCMLAASLGPQQPATLLGETLRNLALIGLIFRLFSADGRDESVRPVRPLIATLALVQLFQPVLIMINARAGFAVELTILTAEVSAILNMLFAIGVLVLLHNLYAGAAAASRQILRWSGIALTGIFTYDLNLFTIAYLTGDNPGLLVSLRGVFTGVLIAVLAFGGSIANARLQFRPSRAVTFQTLSLLVISSYLVIMVLVTRSLTLLGGDFAWMGQIAFLFIGTLVAAICFPSKSVRSWIRVIATKHLFQHRYDYRQEWLRFTQTISRGSSDASNFDERAVKAIADITDSPAGLLLIPNEEAQLELTARWNWPTIAVPAIAAEFELSESLAKHGYILDLDEVRAGIDHHGELQHVPAWLSEAEDVWALVPLIHFDRLVGAIVLARPRLERCLDWEDFDLLRVVGQQLASYLSEQSGQQALMEASRFDEFNRRMAFVMHDIKNLASQMSLLSANAQKHADNPAFREDMLVTLRNSSDKLSSLLARLGRYGAGPIQNLTEIELGQFLEGLKEHFKSAHPVVVHRTEKIEIMADQENLEQAVIHLIQNAIDASDEDAPVHISVSRQGLSGQIDIVDAGHGMSPQFVRSGLFKPFISSKEGGFGIGAFEAREMIKAMGGRIIVESREGVGTRFSVTLPVIEAHRLASQTNSPTALSNEVA